MNDTIVSLDTTADGAVLVLSIPDGRVDQVARGMLAHNEIEGLARPTFLTVDGVTQVRHQVDGLVPLSSVRDAPAGRDAVLRLVGGIADALTEAGRYMLGTQHFSVSDNLAWVDPATGRPILVCVPERDRPREDLAGQLRSLVLALWLERGEDRGYIGEILAALPESGTLDPRRVARVVRGLGVPMSPGAPVAPGAVPSGAAASVDAQHAPPRPGATSPGLPPQTLLPQPNVPGHQAAGAVPGHVPSRGAHVLPQQPAVPAASRGPVSSEHGDTDKQMSLFYLLQHYTADNRAEYARQRKAAQAAAGEHAVPAPVPPPVMGPPAAPVAAAPVPTQAAPSVAPGTPFTETQHVTPAAPAQMPRAYLRRETTGAVEPLNQAVTQIGRRRARVDIAVNGDLVSKNHATIHHDGSGWTIIDVGSTNGVEVDGTRIAAHAAYPLVDGTRIRIGDETLIFIEPR